MLLCNAAMHTNMPGKALAMALASVRCALQPVAHTIPRWRWRRHFDPYLRHALVVKRAQSGKELLGRLCRI